MAPADSQGVLATAALATAVFAAGSVAGLLGSWYYKDSRNVTSDANRAIGRSKEGREGGRMSPRTPHHPATGGNTLFKAMFKRRSQPQSPEDGNAPNNNTNDENGLPGFPGETALQENSNVRRSAPLTVSVQSNTRPRGSTSTTTSTTTSNRGPASALSGTSSTGNTSATETGNARHSPAESLFSAVTPGRRFGTGSSSGHSGGSTTEAPFTPVDDPFRSSLASSVGGDHMPAYRSARYVARIGSIASQGDNETGDEVGTENRGYHGNIDEEEEEEEEVEFEHDEEDDEEIGEGELTRSMYDKAQAEAQHESFVHRSITCNTCGVSPIKGVRYKCANCIDYDICAQCEPTDRHAATHVFIKLRIPIPPLMNPRTKMFDTLYPGRMETAVEEKDFDYDSYKSNKYFNYLEMFALYQQYLSLLTTPEGINTQIFSQCLGPLSHERNLIISRFFKFFDRNGDGFIDFEEFANGVGILCKGKPEERTLYAFQGYDDDRKGFITRSDLRSMLRAYFTLSMELVRDVVKGMELNIVETYDEQSTNPVSSMFTAPIPTGTAENLQHEIDQSNQNRRNSAQTLPLGISPVIVGQGDASGAGTVRRTSQNLSVNTSRPEGGRGSNGSGPQSATSPLDELRRAATLTPYHILMGDTLDIASSASARSGLYSPVTDSGHSDKIPMIEALSMDAIDGIVEAIFGKKYDLEISGETQDEFEARKSNGKIDFREFTLLAEGDSGLVSWFEALGTIF